MNERGMLIGKFRHRAEIDSADYRVGRTNMDIFDDVVTEPPSRELVQEAIAWLRESGLTSALPEMTRGGAYRNAAGELVTWDASEDGSYVTVSTWPGE